MELMMWHYILNGRPPSTEDMVGMIFGLLTLMVLLFAGVHVVERFKSKSKPSIVKKAVKRKRRKK